MHATTPTPTPAPDRALARLGDQARPRILVPGPKARALATQLTAPTHLRAQRRARAQAHAHTRICTCAPSAHQVSRLMHPFPRTEEDDGGPPDGGSGADQRLSWSAHGLRDTTGRTGTYRYMAPEVRGTRMARAACAAASARDGCAAALAWQGLSPSRLGWASDSDGSAPCAPRRRRSRCLGASARR